MRERLRRHESRYFYPRPPRGGRPFTTTNIFTSYEFLPTPSARRATVMSIFDRNPLEISTHALREEGDSPSSRKFNWLCYFYPRPPRGGRRSPSALAWIPLAISTHALREEGDRLHRQPERLLLHFYPRPPRGGRPKSALRIKNTTAFLPTPSARRATLLQPQHWIISKAFLPTPSARRATSSSCFCVHILSISTHALREEGDAGQPD